ncbi:MAG: M81 family metallopeptidase [Sphingobium sp.]
MKIYYGGLSTETNAFSPIPCGVEDFVDSGLLTADRPDTDLVFEAVHAVGGTVIRGLNLIAQPAGPVTAAAYEALTRALIDDIAALGPFSGIILNLHGAMAAETVSDCEGDILRRVRALVGPGVFIGAVLDPHSHLTSAMLGHADVLIAYREYPHTDIADATAKLFDLCVHRLCLGIAMLPCVFDCAQIDIYYTAAAPMRDLLAELELIEEDPEILSISIIHGFPWGDSADLGTKILVYVRSDIERGRALAADIGNRMIGLRGTCGPKPLDAGQAISIARELDGIVVMADIADNAGGGAPGDSTFLLKSLLQHPGPPSLIGAIWDPVSVGLAFKAGLGNRIALRIGGKVGASSGDPVDIVGKVVGLARDHRETAPGYGDVTIDFGDVAAIRIDRITIVMSTLRSQVFSPDIFRAVGIAPEEMKIIAVKSTQHFRAGFDALADHVLYVDTPGALSLRFERLPYRHVPRTHWPRLEGAA